jgi:hypothetical protein
MKYVPFFRGVCIPECWIARLLPFTLDFVSKIRPPALSDSSYENGPSPWPRNRQSLAVGRKGHTPRRPPREVPKREQFLTRGHMPELGRAVPAAKVLPSRANATAITGLRCCATRIGCWFFSCTKSQSLTVLSTLAVARVLPSAARASDTIPPVFSSASKSLAVRGEGNHADPSRMFTENEPLLAGSQVP